MEFRLLMRALAVTVATAATLVLAGCAGTPSKGGSRPATAAATGPVMPSGPLAGEARWLQSLFNGTPVQVVPEPEGALRLEVPMSYAFDGESAVPKPPLKAVLDKVALSLYRQPTARVHLGPPGPAARERLAALRSYLGTKGVTPQRMLAAAPAQADQLLLRLTPAPTAIERLDDDALPAQPVMAPKPALRPPSAANR